MNGDSRAQDKDRLSGHSGQLEDSVELISPLSFCKDANFYSNVYDLLRTLFDFWLNTLGFVYFECELFHLNELTYCNICVDKIK